MLSSYPKVYSIGHRDIAELFFDPVVVQEKLDGSQIQWGYVDGCLQIKSHHREIDPDNPDSMFRQAVDVIKDLANEGEMTAGWVYRGEYLSKPKHNTLVYGRVPENNIIIFDITFGLEAYLSPEEVKQEAERLGFEVVPTYHIKEIGSFEDISDYLEKESILGGTNVEGVVFKNYHRFGRDGHVLMGKYVSEKFKEMNASRNKLKSSKNVLEEIGSQYRTEARWEKGIQHLREFGSLSDEPKDIGPLLKEINQDVLDECVEEIKEKLFKWAWKGISREVTKGFPAWYKERLAKSQFVGDKINEEE